MLNIRFLNKGVMKLQISPSCMEVIWMYMKARAVGRLILLAEMKLPGEA